MQKKQIYIYIYNNNNLIYTCFFLFFSQKHLRCLGSRLAALAARERYGSDEKVDGGETVRNSLGRAPLGGNGWKQRLGGRRGKTVGNSMGRAPWGRSEMEATRRWTEGKPWEIAWGELRGEGAIRKRR